MAQRRVIRLPSRPAQGRRDGIRWRTQIAVPLVNGFAASVVAPVNGYVTRDRRQKVTVLGKSLLGTPMDIQVEWRTSVATQTYSGGPWVPDPKFVTNQPGVPSETPFDVAPPTDLTYVTWFYRVRAGNASSGVWGLWSPQFFFDVLPVLGSTTGYIDLNVGVENVSSRGDIRYIDMNVGVAKVSSRGAQKYVAINIGVATSLFNPTAYADLNIYPPTGKYQAAGYLDMNMVTDQTPKPHIWWIRPEQGKEGYIFNIYGHGFGDFQGEHNGKIQLGSLVCSISKWQVIPSELVSSVVRVTGTPRGTSAINYPYVLLNPAGILLQAGDIIEYDMLWEIPSQSRLDIFPYFELGNSTEIGTDYLLNDDAGTPWVSDQPGAKGTWLHRRFVIPQGNALVGRTASNFGVAWYGYDALQPVRTASIRSFVVRAADGTVKSWITGDDNKSAPSLTYVANAGVLTSAEYNQEGFVIQHGQGLEPDLITPEHGWIVAIVPPGAVSADVQVVLEGS